VLFPLRAAASHRVAQCVRTSNDTLWGNCFLRVKVIGYGSSEDYFQFRRGLGLHGTRSPFPCPSLGEIYVPSFISLIIPCSTPTELQIPTNLLMDAHIYVLVGIETYGPSFTYLNGLVRLRYELLQLIQSPMTSGPHVVLPSREHIHTCTNQRQVTPQKGHRQNINSPPRN